MALGYASLNRKLLKMNSIIDKNNPLKLKISSRDLKRKQIVSSPIPVKKKIRVIISSIRSKPVIKSTASKNDQEEYEISNDRKVAEKICKHEYSSKWLLGLARHLKNKINPTQSERANACLEMMKDGFVINEVKHSIEFLSYLKSQFVRQVTGINDNTSSSLQMLLQMTRSISISQINQLLNDNSCVYWSGTHFKTDNDSSILEDF